MLERQQAPPLKRVIEFIERYQGGPSEKYVVCPLQFP